MKKYIKQKFANKVAKNMPVVFLDRDGVITKKFSFLLDKESISIYKPAIAAIRLLNYYGFPILIVTNQPAVARGWISTHELKEINEELVSILKINNAFINGIYSCPHHPNANLLKFKVICRCRKPETLIINDVLKEFKTDTGYIIGDKTTDIEAGKKAEIKTMLVNTGYRGRDKTFKVKPDFTCRNALSAARTIIKDFKNFSPHIQPEHR